MFMKIFCIFCVKSLVYMTASHSNPLCSLVNQCGKVFNAALRKGPGHWNQSSASAAVI